MSENLLKKISAKNVCGEIVAPAIGLEVPLMIVMGYAKSMESKATVYGDSMAFYGDFKAINVATGEAYRSGTCYLPDVAEDLLKSILGQTEGVVEFGFAVSAVGVKGRTPGEAGKYEYRCKPLMEASEKDPMRALEEQLKKRLAAPKEEHAKGKK